VVFTGLQAVKAPTQHLGVQDVVLGPAGGINPLHAHTGELTRALQHAFAVEHGGRGHHVGQAGQIGQTFGLGLDASA
jgi:hypothetical protein